MDDGVARASKVMRGIVRRLPGDMREDAFQTAWVMTLTSGRLGELGPEGAGYKFGRRAVRSTVNHLPREVALPENDDGEVIELVGKEDTDPLEAIIIREVLNLMDEEEARVFLEMYTDPSDREGKYFGVSYRDLGAKLGMSKEKARRLMTSVRQIVVNYLEGRR